MVTKMNKSMWERYQDQLYGEPEGWAVTDYELFKELYYKELNRRTK